MFRRPGFTSTIALKCIEDYWSDSLFAFLCSDGSQQPGILCCRQLLHTEAPRENARTSELECFSQEKNGIWATLDGLLCKYTNWIWPEWLPEWSSRKRQSINHLNPAVWHGRLSGSLNPRAGCLPVVVRCYHATRVLCTKWSYTSLRYFMDCSFRSKLGYEQDFFAPLQVVFIIDGCPSCTSTAVPNKSDIIKLDGWADWMCRRSYCRRLWQGQLQKRWKKPLKPRKNISTNVAWINSLTDAGTVM